MKLNRTAIQRMIDTGALNVGGRRNAGSSGGGGGGGVSATWVDENYISKAFFNQLFTIHSDTVTQADPNGEVIEPNDTESTVASIQALVGLWTEQYVSALGLNSGGGGGGGVTLTEPLASINQMNRTPSNGQTLIYQNNQWTYGSISGGSVTSVGMRVPTGLSVTPATITSSGTFVISFSTGYSIPTTANQTNWDTAYGWGNHATAGYASASSVQTLQGYFDGIGNAKSALKLTTISKTAWGRTYWTVNGVPESIDGDIENARNIKIDNNAKIYWKKYNTTTYLSMLTLDTSNNFIVGEAMANEGLTTYLRGRSITFQTGTGSSGNHSASMSDGGLFTVEKLKIGSIVISEDTINGSLHIEGAGLYADTYISALGANSGGGGGGGATLKEPLDGINNSGLGAPLPGTQTGAAIVFNGTNWTYSHSQGIVANYFDSIGYIRAINNITSTSGNLQITSGRAAIGGAVNISYKLFVAGNICSNYMVLGDDATVGTVTCTTIKTLSSRGLSVQTSGNAPCYTNVAWSTSSDMRLKRVIEDITTDISNIAKAPIFNFEWIKGGNKALGTSAQYWQNIFPYAVLGDQNNYLSMDYGGVALAAAVITARRVVELEKKIKELESKLQ